MPAPQPPLLLADNLLDTVQLYPSAVMTSTAVVAGREPWRVADGRQERSWCEFTGAGADPTGNWIQVDLGNGITKPADMLVLGRGHNLAGKTVKAEGSADGVTFDVSVTLTVPAAVTAGGDPATATMCTTEEVAHWSLFAALAARRYWRFRVPYVASFVPRIPTIMLGTRMQFAGYSAIFDDTARQRKTPAEESDYGMVATGHISTWRTAELDMTLIAATEYDGTILRLGHEISSLGSPVWLVPNYGTAPARAGLFRYDSRSWRAPLERAYRSVRLPFREIGHPLRAYPPGGVVAPPPSSGDLVSDMFNRADNTTSLGSADTGHVWTARSGTWGIDTNQARCYVGASHEYATVDAGQADVEAEVKVASGASEGRVLIRHAGGAAHDYILAVFQISGFHSIYRVTANTFTSIASMAGSMAYGDLLMIRGAGSAITAHKNGVQILSATESQGLANTHCGFGGFNPGAGRFEDFVARPAP